MTPDIAFDFHNKIFRITHIDGESTEVDTNTVFQFKQDGNIIWATYKGGKVRRGQLLGLISPPDQLTHHYSQVNLQGEIHSGEGKSELRINGQGKIEIVENWTWQNKAGSGSSVMTEE